MKVFLTAAWILLINSGIMAAQSISLVQLLEAYGDMQYPRVRRLATKYAGLPEARLLKALSAVFDRKDQDLEFGLSELWKIYNDKSFSPKLRLQAGLAYARAVQTLQMREGIYPVAEGIDFDSIYSLIIKTYPDSVEACFAAVYQAQSYLDSDDLAEAKKGIKLLEKFLKSYKGPREYLSGINILVADQYVLVYKDYSKAVEFLKAAFECGISNPQNSEKVLFRIARSYDLKLKDKKSAVKYYNMFIEKFPNSSTTPVAKRHLKNLEGKSE